MKLKFKPFGEGIIIGPIKLLGTTFVGGKEKPLIIRHILFRCPAFGVYLHHLMRSDYDRALHNHPWSFIAIILKGGYWEFHDQTNDRRETQEWRGAGRVLLRPSSWRHRLELPRPAWSLVLVGRREQPWGFCLPTGWCWWRKHNPALNICEDEPIHVGGED